MTRTLIYVIAAFALWLYFKYGSFTTSNGKGFENTRGQGFGSSDRVGGGGFSGGAGATRGFSNTSGNRGGGFGGGNNV